MSGRQRLLVAALLRGREAHEIDALRSVLGSSELDRIAPHITLIAPTNVPDSSVATFVAAVELAVTSSVPMSIELNEIATFPPGHHVIYLRVDGEVDRLGALRNRLASGANEPDDGRPFVPHVTLRSHANRVLVDHAISLMASYRLPLVIDRITLLRLDESSPRRVWRPYDEFMLGSSLTVGRGGREIVLSRASMMSPQDREFLDANAAAEPGESRHDDGSSMSDTERETVVVRARIDGVLAGLVMGVVHGEFFELEDIVVDAGRRREGIGRQLMRYLERSATELGIRELLVATDSTSVAFFGALGFDIASAVRDVPRVRMTRSVDR